MTRSARHRVRIAIGSAVVATLACLTLAPAPAVGDTSPGEVGYVILRGDSGCTLARVDLATGALTTIGPTTFAQCAFDLEFGADGTTLYGVRITLVSSCCTEAQLVAFATESGASTLVGPIVVTTFGQRLLDTQGVLTVDGADRFATLLSTPPPFPSVPDRLAACHDALCLMSFPAVDPHDASVLGPVPQGRTIFYGLATSCTGVTLSARASGDPPDAGWLESPPAPEELTSMSLSGAPPVTTDIGPVHGAVLSSLDFDPSGGLFGVGEDSVGAPALFAVDPTTGGTTRVATLTVDGQPTTAQPGGFAIAHPCGPIATEVVLAPSFTG